MKDYDMLSLTFLVILVGTLLYFLVNFFIRNSFAPTNTQNKISSSRDLLIKQREHTEAIQRRHKELMESRRQQVRDMQRR